MKQSHTMQGLCFSGFSTLEKYFVYTSALSGTSTISMRCVVIARNCIFIQLAHIACMTFFFSFSWGFETICFVSAPVQLFYHTWQCQKNHEISLIKFTKTCRREKVFLRTVKSHFFAPTIFSRFKTSRHQIFAMFRRFAKL